MMNEQNELYVTLNVRGIVTDENRKNAVKIMVVNLADRLIEQDNDILSGSHVFLSIDSHDNKMSVFERQRLEVDVINLFVDTLPETMLAHLSNGRPYIRIPEK